MLSNDEFAEIRERAARLGSKRVSSQYGSIPASVEYLETVLEGDLSDDDRADVYSLLVNESSKADNDRLYVDVLRRRVAALPNDPMSHAGLAFRLALIDPASRKEAVEAGYKAVELAKFQDRHVRYSATLLTRIGLLLDDYTVIQYALGALVDDAGKTRGEDSRYEFDFVAQIDTRRCDPALLARYQALS